MNSIDRESQSSEAARPLTPHLSKSLCLYCKTPLTVHQEVRGGICDRLVCRTRKSTAVVLQRQREESEATWKAAQDYREWVLKQKGEFDAESFRLAVIPGLERALTKLSRKRREEFRANLKDWIRQAFEEPLHSDGVEELHEELLSHVSAPETASPTMGASCAVCQGHCCRNGGNKAYLTPAVIRSFLVRHPGLKVGEVLRAYLSKVPDETVADSCIYHGAKGCGLSREMRSAICNRFFCSGLKTLQREIADHGEKTTLLVCIEGTKVSRSAIVEPDGKTTRMDAGPVALA